MLGCRNGVGTQLIRFNPYMIQVHCVAHKLALCLTHAAKTVSAIAKFKDTVWSIYNFFLARQ